MINTIGVNHTKRAVWTRLLLRSALLSFALAGEVLAQTDFYFDNGRTVSGDGSAASPWKERSYINWTAILSALENGPVTLYFSSRSTWNVPVWTILPPGTNGSASRRLTLDGQSKYNTVATGPAVWQTESDPTKRATFHTTIGQSGGSIIVHHDSSFITIRGFRIVNPAGAGIALGEVKPTLNLHDILIENNVIERPQKHQGIWFGYAEAGCYNVTVRGNTISDTPLEGIYMGHWKYLANTMTGVVVEENTLINTGTHLEGDIDIKAPAFGAIVRNNTIYSTGPGKLLAGIVVQASDVQVYGNALFNLQPAATNDGGTGIQINADGAEGVGHPLANILVYNNLIYGNAQQGILMNAWKASISNTKILNNTIVGNRVAGFTAGAGLGNTIEISVLANNIFSQNGGIEIATNENVTLTSVDRNVIYHPAGGTFLSYGGVGKTYAEWKDLGFDLNGMNADPMMDPSNDRLLPESPAIGAGGVRSEFTTDIDGIQRGTAWDIGAYEFNGIVPPSLATPTLNLPPSVALHSQISAGYSGGVVPTYFRWTFTPETNSSQTSMGAQAMGVPSTVSFNTPSTMAKLATSGLGVGRYLISVTAHDAGRNRSNAATANLTLIAGNLDNVKVYPNPWRSDRHPTLPITFDELGLNTEIKIFTVSGHHVKTLPASSTLSTWDLTNNSGDRVASGIYLYLLKSDDGKKTGQLVVIK